MKKSILNGTFIGLAAKLISSVGAFLIIPLMLKQLGSNNFGMWMTISSAAMFIGIMDFGMGDGLLSIIAKNLNDRDLIKRQISIAYSVQIFIVLLVGSIFLSLFWFIDWEIIFKIRNPSNDMLTCIFITFFSFLLGLVSNTVYSIQMGLQRTDLANLGRLISGVFSIIATYLLLTFSPSIKWIAFTTLSIPVIVSSINTAFFLKRNKLMPNRLFRVGLKEAFGFLKTGSIFLYLQIVAFILYQTDTLILAHYTSFEKVSRFIIIAKLFSIANIALGIYLQVLWPIYAKGNGSNNWSWMKKAFYKSLFGSIGAIIIFVVGLFFVKDILLSYWLNTSFVIPVFVFASFSVWIAISAMDANIQILLSGMHLFAAQVYSSIATVVANLFFSIILVEKYGIAGVVWGTSIASIFFSFIPLFFYLRKIFKQKEVTIELNVTN